MASSTLSLDGVRRVAAQTACRETGSNAKHGVVNFKCENGGVEVCVFYDTATVCVLLDHPRLNKVSVFRYGVDLATLVDIFANPLEDCPDGYRRSVPMSYAAPLESEEAALRRQLEALEKENKYIDREISVIKRRAAQAGFNLSSSSSSGDVSKSKMVDQNSPSNGLQSLSSAARGPVMRNAAVRSSGISQALCESDEDNSGRGGENSPGEDMNTAIGMLLRQQSEVNSQLESLLLRNNSVRKSATGMQLGGSQELSRSSSQTRASPSAPGPSGPNNAAGGAMVIGGTQKSGLLKGAMARGEDRPAGPSNKAPFQTQKSLPNSNPSLSNTNSPFRQRGNQCCYALFKAEYHAEFGTAWSRKPANVVALGRGYVIIYDDGSVTWWDVPELLDAKLNDQKASTLAVRYVALGADENYYVKFADGKMEWCGPDGFGETLRRGIQKSRLLVDKVAFGPNQGWLVLWSDGTVEHSRLPTTLKQLLEGMTPDQYIKDLSIGPNEEWFAIFKDNAVRADNLPDSLYRILSEIQESGGRVRQVIFGEHSSWYVRYWDGKG